MKNPGTRPGFLVLCTSSISSRRCHFYNDTSRHCGSPRASEFGQASNRAEPGHRNEAKVTEGQTAARDGADRLNLVEFDAPFVWIGGRRHNPSHPLRDPRDGLGAWCGLAKCKFRDCAVFKQTTTVVAQPNRLPSSVIFQKPNAVGVGREKDRVAICGNRIFRGLRKLGVASTPTYTNHLHPEFRGLRRYK